MAIYLTRYVVTDLADEAYLHCPEDFLPPEQIEGHLPEEGINGILDDHGKAGAKSVVVQVAQPEVLFHDVTLFRYLFVPLFLIIG